MSDTSKPSILSRIWRSTRSRNHGVWLNLDRAVDNAVLDDGTDHTISGDCATHPALKPLKAALDATLPGGAHGKHCENAAYDDAAQQDALKKAETK